MQNLCRGEARGSSRSQCRCSCVTLGARRVRARDGLQRDLGAAQRSATATLPTTSSGRRCTPSLGLVLFVVLLALDYRALRRLARRSSCVEPRAAARGARGRHEPVNGAQRWLDASARPTFQPSELAKLALAIWAACLPRAQGSRRSSLARARAPDRAAGRGLLPCSCSLEPDLGTAIAIVIDARRDAARRPARRGAACSAGGLGIASRPRRRSRSGSSPYRRARFLSFLDPVARRAGRRLPDRAGDDRRSARAASSASASARASRRSTTCPRLTRT